MTRDALDRRWREQIVDQPVPDPVLHELDEPASIQLVEEGPYVRISDPVDLAPFDPVCQRVERIMRTASRSEPIAEPEELRLEYRRQDGLGHRSPDDLVLQCRNAKRSCSPVRFRYLHPPGRKRPARPAVNAIVQAGQALFQPVPVFLQRHPVHACRRVRCHMVQERSEFLLRFPRGCLPYPLGRP